MAFGVLVGCSNQEKSVYISAASSLTESLQDLQMHYKNHQSEVKTYLNLASTSALKTQMIQGAPVDIFLSANQTHFDEIKKAGYIEEGQALLTNKLICIVAHTNTSIKTLEDLGEQPVRLVLAQAEVPIGKYSEEVLDNAKAYYGEDYKEKVLDKVVSREMNVKQALIKVVLGEAEATFVYATDVTPEVKEKIRIIEIPEAINTEVTYWVGLTKQGADKEEAVAFYKWLLQKEAQAIFHKYGFNEPSIKSKYNGTN